MKTLGARQWPAVLSLRMGKTTDTVLDDHNRSVDDDAEVECAQTHQIGAHLVSHHPSESKQHRQGNHGRRDDGCANVAQEQEQDHDHQDRAFQQVLLHRADRFIHQDSTVVNGDRMNAFRQAAVDFIHFFVDGL